jgi:hypothetical protein
MSDFIDEFEDFSGDELFQPSAQKRKPITPITELI